MVFGGGGTNLGTAVLELRGDTRSLKRDLDRAERTTRNRVARIGKIVAGFGIAGIGTGIFGGINVLRAASSLEESTNAVNVVFKDAASTILDFSKTASTAVGLAQADFNQLATQTGALLKITGLSEAEAAEQTLVLTNRAADLASVYDTNVKDALFAINAALRGETEPIRRYAADVTDATLQTFLLSQGITAVVSSMSQQEKGQLRIQALLHQTTDVQGDFANIADSFANRIRILSAQFTDYRAELGGHLIPVAKAVLALVASRLIPAFQQWGTWIEENREAIRDFFQRTWAVARPILEDLRDGLVIVGDAARAFGQWLIDNKVVLVAALTLIGVAFVTSLGPVSLAVIGLTGLVTLLGVCPRIRSWRRKTPRNNLLTVIWTLSWSN